MLNGLEADAISEDSTIKMLDLSIFTSLGLGFFTGFAQSPRIQRFIQTVGNTRRKYFPDIFAMNKLILNVYNEIAGKNIDHLHPLERYQQQLPRCCCKPTEVNKQKSFDRAQI